MLLVSCLCRIPLYNQASGVVWAEVHLQFAIDVRRDDTAAAPLNECDKLYKQQACLQYQDHSLRILYKLYRIAWVK